MPRMLAACLFWVCATGALVARAGDMPWVSMDPASRTTFRREGAGPFVSVGVNYFDHQTGWAPRLWQRFDEARVRRHLAMIRGRGFNTIRLFLTYESFHREPGRVSGDGPGKFRKLLAICRELGLYLIASGPDHWEGTPEWRRAADRFADENILAADEAWWAEFARMFGDEPAILAWDVYNEPAIGWDSPALRRQWNEWLKRRYGSVDKIAAAWARKPEEIGTSGSVDVPPREPAPGDARLYDYQCFRETVADEWTGRMTRAIRSADRRHLITVGHVQWTVPVCLPTIWHYAAFDVKQNARHVDFVTIHFYPLAPPRPCDSPEGIEANAVYLEALLYLCTTDKPLMIGEFGWYGGGELRVDGRVEYPDRPPSHQVEWCSELLNITRGRCVGWLNWAFADPPEARDLSRWSGCWTESLQLKPWGDVFGRFARRVTACPDPPRDFPAYVRSFPFDRRALLTSPEAGNHCRAELARLRRTSPQGKGDPGIGEPRSRSPAAVKDRPSPLRARS